MQFERKFSKAGVRILKLNVGLSVLFGIHYLALYIAYLYFQTPEFIAKYTFGELNALINQSALFRYVYTAAQPIMILMVGIAILSVIMLVIYAYSDDPKHGVLTIYTCLTTSIIGGAILL